jgi:hypothetical protein
MSGLRSQRQLVATRPSSCVRTQVIVIISKSLYGTELCISAEAAAACCCLMVDFVKLSGVLGHSVRCANNTGAEWMYHGKAVAICTLHGLIYLVS